MIDVVGAEIGDATRDMLVKLTEFAGVGTAKLLSDGLCKEAGVRLVKEGKTDAEDTSKLKLFALVVGISVDGIKSDGIKSDGMAAEIEGAEIDALGVEMEVTPMPVDCTFTEDIDVLCKSRMSEDTDCELGKSWTEMDGGDAAGDFEGIARLVEGSSTDDDSIGPAGAWVTEIEFDGTDTLGALSRLLENCGRAPFVDREEIDATTVGDGVVGADMEVERILAPGELILDSAVVMLIKAAEVTEGVEGETFVGEGMMDETAIVRKLGMTTVTEVREVHAALNVTLLVARIGCEGDVERDDHAAAENIGATLLLLRKLEVGMDFDKLDNEVEGGAGATTGGTCTFAPVAATNCQSLMLKPSLPRPYLLSVHLLQLQRLFLARRSADSAEESH